LALLLDRPGHGYELTRRLNGLLGPSWNVEAASVYVLLDRLEADGIVRRETLDLPQGVRRQRERVVYYPTERAEEWRRAWMARPARRESTRSEMLAKLAVARAGEERLILAAVDEYARHVVEMLMEYDAEQRPAATAFESLMLDMIDDDIRTLLRAEQRWARRSKRRILEYMGEQDG
jgi:DNA-binding PadR family transcriptional regulator